MRLIFPAGAFAGLYDYHVNPGMNTHLTRMESAMKYDIVMTGGRAPKMKNKFAQQYATQTLVHMVIWAFCALLCYNRVNSKLWLISFIWTP